MSSKNIYLYLLGTILFVLPNITYTQDSKVSTETDMQYEDEKSRIYIFGFDISGVKPTSFFANNISGIKLGFTTDFLFQFKPKQPLFIGIELYYNRLESATDFFDEFIDFSLVTIEYTTTSHLLGFGPKARYYPSINLKYVEPYIEASLGYKVPYTTTNKYILETESEDTRLNKASWSLTYGIGGGLSINVKENWYINVRGSYLQGLSSSYYALNPNNTASLSTLDYFTLRKSNTHIFRFDLGVSYLIGT